MKTFNDSGLLPVPELNARVACDIIMTLIYRKCSLDRLLSAIEFSGDQNFYYAIAHSNYAKLVQIAQHLGVRVERMLIPDKYINEKYDEAVDEWCMRLGSSPDIMEINGLHLVPPRDPNNSKAKSQIFLILIAKKYSIDLLEGYLDEIECEDICELVNRVLRNNADENTKILKSLEKTCPTIYPYYPVRKSKHFG